jgi:hypothetical protein
MVEIEMVLKVREVGESLDTLFKHEDCQDREAVLIRASFSNVGESLVGGLTLRSKRVAVCAEPSNTSCPSATLMLSTSPSKATVASSHASSVSSQPIPIVLQEKHNPYVTDKGHLVTWLDAMKAQSPPQFHSLHGDTPESYDMEAAEYAAWLKKHPSALSMFEELMVEAKAKQVVVFLDYDGTLSPIVEDPDRAYVSDDVCQHLHAFPDKASFSEMPCTLLGSDTSLSYLL